MENFVIRQCSKKNDCLSHTPVSVHKTKNENSTEICGAIVVWPIAVVIGWFSMNMSMKWVVSRVIVIVFKALSSMEHNEFQCH